MTSGRFVTFVVDDNRSVLKSLSRLLRTKGYEVRAYESGREFLDQHDPDVPGCAVLDLSMPGMSGLEIQQELAATAANRPVLFLSGSAEVPASVKAMKWGAVDFLTKPAKARDLLEAIAAACDRQLKAREERAEMDGIQARLANLTQREREVLSGVVAGQLNKQIAVQLGISLKTVKLHRSRMMRKMDVRSVPDLVRLADLARVRN
jgi:FixJ family two-component response regulator